MRKILLACAFAVLFGTAPWARSQPSPTPGFYIKQEPLAEQGFPYEGVAFIDDGTCPTGEIKKVTVAAQSRGRERQCIAWPPGLTRLQAWPPDAYLKQEPRTGPPQTDNFVYYVDRGECSAGEITEFVGAAGGQFTRRCIPWPAAGLTPAIRFLPKDEVGAALAGRVILFTLRADGRRLRWDFWRGGRVFGSVVGRSYGGGGMSGISGVWEVKDDGGMCIKWNIGQTDCNYFFWEGDKLDMTYQPNTRAAAIGAVTVEFEK